MISMNFKYYFYLNFLSILVMILMVLVGVAFLTLLERKILGLVQIRKGPNKVGLSGVFQPFSDALKLLSKELMIIYKSNYMIYFVCPILMMMMMMMMWLLVPVITNIYFMNYSMLLMIIFMSMGGYILLFSGWSSNSVYSMLGSLRSISQMLSYEVSFILILMVMMILSESFSLLEVSKWQLMMWNLWFLMPLLLVFFISILAELNRSPMDFVEGESELVSGFNIEYFSGGFAMIFLAEYGMILFFSLVMVVIFTNLLINNMYLMWLFFMIFCSLIIFMRGMLPRMRYDELMKLCWKIILPFVLSYLMFMVGFKYFMVIIN